MSEMFTWSPASRLFAQPFIHAQIKENIKRRVTGLCAGNWPVTGEFPALLASNAENDSIWWRHHEILTPGSVTQCTPTFLWMIRLQIPIIP